MRWVEHFFRWLNPSGGAPDVSRPPWEMPILSQNPDFRAYVRFLAYQCTLEALSIGGKGPELSQDEAAGSVDSKNGVRKWNRTSGDQSGAEPGNHHLADFRGSKKHTRNGVKNPTNYLDFKTRMDNSSPIIEPIFAPNKSFQSVTQLFIMARRLWLLT